MENFGLNKDYKKIDFANVSVEELAVISGGSGTGMIPGVGYPTPPTYPGNYPIGPIYFQSNQPNNYTPTTDSGTNYA